ncbi:integrase catalytic domain-containing protein [Alistipes putredinis]|uniref:integrase catalytic domain-containing protein n=2 Tax=Alistipes putredinis TaxID=28117 RepID=UPI003AB56F37
MEYFGNIIAVTMHELTRSDDGEAVMSRSAYDHLVTRGRVNVLRPGKGLGSYALIEYHSLPERFRLRFEAKYGNPEKIMKQEDMPLAADSEAQKYYHEYLLPNGEHLPEDKQTEYTLNARVLNALREMRGTQKAMRRACNNNTPVIWSNIFATAEELRKAYGHTLPKSEARLRDKLRQYTKEGYACLVSGKFCNANTLKITKAAGRQIVALRRCRVPVYTTKQLFEEFNRIAERRGWKRLASQSSLVQYLERPEIKPLWYDAVYGELAAKQLYARRNKTEMPTMRDSLWYGDGTKLNLFYKAVENGKTVVRSASVYEVIDAYSETLLGYAVSDTENFDAQFRAFRMAIETAGHKPYEIVTDNQGGQRSKIAQKFFANICRINRPTAPYNAPSKSIESVFGRFQKQVLHEDWRFTGGNITSKEAWKINREFLEANKEKLFTYEEMLEAYSVARSKWNAMKHYQTGIAHEEMYRTSVNPATERVTELDMIDLFWLTTERPSIFTADGITIQYQNRKYTYEVLTSDGTPDYAWRSENTGREFFVRFDPKSMDRALLYEQTPMGLRYETVAYPYLTVRRNIQEQQEGDMELIRYNDEANKRERVRRQIEAHALELEHGVAPEQHGLRTPAIKGISEKEYERLADTVVVVPSEQYSEPVTVGEYTKAVSNLDCDPTAIFNRM